MIDLDLLQSAFSNLFVRFIDFTPRLLTTIIILVIGWVVSKFLSNLVKKLADRVGFDGLVEKTGLAGGLAEAQVSQTPSGLLGTFVFWLIFLNFILTGFESLGLNSAVNQLQAIIGFLPRVLVAVLTMIAGSLLARFVSQLAEAGVASTGLEFHKAIGQVVYGILLVVVAIIAIQQLGLDVTVLTNMVTYLIAIITAGLALAFGLGGRDVARNVLAGHYARELFEVGSRVVVADQPGTLEAIGTLTAEIVVGQERLILPNKALLEGQVTITEEI